MTPEEIQKQERAQAAARFCEEMIGVVRARLFKGVEGKDWWQHERIVRRAILEPARYLNERGAAGTAERYRTILTTVISTIEAHGDLGAIRRMAYYFCHAVQEHMRVQGDRYYEEAKTPRTAGAIVGGVLRGLEARRRDSDLTAALASAAAVVGSRGGRKKRGPTAQQGSLF